MRLSDALRPDPRERESPAVQLVPVPIGPGLDQEAADRWGASRQFAEFLMSQVAHSDDHVAVFADLAEMTGAQPGQGQLMPPGRSDRPGGNGISRMGAR